VLGFKTEEYLKMVNLNNRPHHFDFNNYDTIAKDIEKYFAMFPNMGNMSLAEYKRRTSTIYDIKEIHSCEDLSQGNKNCKI